MKLTDREFNIAAAAYMQGYSDGHDDTISACFDGVDPQESIMAIDQCNKDGGLESNIQQVEAVIYNAPNKKIHTDSESVPLL